MFSAGAPSASPTASPSSAPRARSRTASPAGPAGCRGRRARCAHVRAVLSYGPDRRRARGAARPGCGPLRCYPCHATARLSCPGRQGHPVDRSGRPRSGCVRVGPAWVCDPDLIADPAEKPQVSAVSSAFLAGGAGQEAHNFEALEGEVPPSAHTSLAGSRYRYVRHGDHGCRGADACGPPRQPHPPRCERRLAAPRRLRRDGRAGLQPGPDDRRRGRCGAAADDRHHRPRGPGRRRLLDGGGRVHLRRLAARAGPGRAGCRAAELRKHPKDELEELAALYESRGVEPALARQVAEQLSRDPEQALEIHAREELGIDPADLPSPPSPPSPPSDPSRWARCCPSCRICWGRPPCGPRCCSRWSDCSPAGRSWPG